MSDKTRHARAGNKATCDKALAEISPLLGP